MGVAAPGRAPTSAARGDRLGPRTSGCNGSMERVGFGRAPTAAARGGHLWPRTRRSTRSTGRGASGRAPTAAARGGHLRPRRCRSPRPVIGGVGAVGVVRVGTDPRAGGFDEARARAWAVSHLHRHEVYTLLVPADARFAAGWDASLVAMHRALPRPDTTLLTSHCSPPRDRALPPPAGAPRAGAARRGRVATR